MAVQTAYNWTTGRGIAGGLVDLTPHIIDTFINEENTGVLKPGMGVMAGTTAGKQIKVFKTGGSPVFEGVVNNNRTTEYDLDGHLRMRKGAGVGVVRWGRVWVRVPAGVTIAYGDGLYIIGAGDNAGFFTNTDNSSANPAVPGRFIGPAENGIAPAEIYHSDTAAAAANAAAAAGVATAVAALKLGDLADVTLTSESDGEVLKYDGTDKVWENGTDETT